MSLVPPTARVAVLGAGVLGLSYAYFLNKLHPGVAIDVYERQARPGGWIDSDVRLTASTTTALEKGPRTLRGVSDGSIMLVDMLQTLGLGAAVHGVLRTLVANRKYLLHDGRLVAVPHSAASAAEFLMGPVGAPVAAQAMWEPFRRSKPPRGDESVALFLDRRFGTPLDRQVVSAVFHGVYAGNTAELSAETVVPSLVAAEREHGSVVVAMLKKALARWRQPVDESLSESLMRYAALAGGVEQVEAVRSSLKRFPMVALAGGLDQLPQALAQALQLQPNVRIHYNLEVEAIVPAGRGGVRVVTTTATHPVSHVHSTVSPAVLSPLVPLLSPLLGQLQHASIWLMNVYIPGKNVLRHRGFGYLVPRGGHNPERLLGVIFDSEVERWMEPVDGRKQSAEKEPYTKLTVMMGGHYFKDGVPLDPVNLAAAKAALAAHLGIDLDAYTVVDASQASVRIEPRPDTAYVLYRLNRACLPQFNVGFGEWRRQVDAAVAAEFGSQVTLGGMAFGRGAGVPDCVAHACDSAHRWQPAGTA